MSTNRVSIKDFLQRSASIIIDVRSPGEYHHAHMPGAVNIPLFTNEERKVVGTAYKQQSREQAIKIGLDFFGPKMRKIVEEVEGFAKPKAQIGDLSDRSEIVNQKSEIFLYCWRGGMRSAAIAWLLDLYGFKITTLAGGYKAYRNHVLQQLAFPYRVNVLGGYTGSGKTELLHELKNKGAAVIDLEKIAAHKGSAFGNMGMAQPTQEMFENLLSHELYLVKDQIIWIEDESQRIGLVNIPGAFWNILRSAPVYFLNIPFEERLAHITAEYGTFDKEILVAAIQRITKRLGGLETKNALAHLADDNLTECFQILLKYYDKRYLKGLQKREALPSLLTKINCEKVAPGNADLLFRKHQYI